MSFSLSEFFRCLMDSVSLLSARVDSVSLLSARVDDLLYYAPTFHNSFYTSHVGRKWKIPGNKNVEENTVCPKSLNKCYSVSNFIKWVNTSWTCSTKSGIYNTFRGCCLSKKS